VNSKEVLTALRRITRAIYLHSKQLERRVGLTVPQILVLQAINENERPSVSDIARQVSLSQATVTSVINRLVKKNLVVRERSTSDRRKVRVSLTESAVEVLGNVPDLLQEDFILRFEMLESWEQKMLVSSLDRVASLMDAQNVDASPILETGEILENRNSEGTDS
jgi:DNA-binding MarR family transcriptional regulator